MGWCTLIIITKCLILYSIILIVEPELKHFREVKIPYKINRVKWRCSCWPWNRSCLHPHWMKLWIHCSGWVTHHNKRQQTPGRCLIISTLKSSYRMNKGRICQQSLLRRQTVSAVLQWRVAPFSFGQTYRRTGTICIISCFDSPCVCLQSDGIMLPVGCCTLNYISSATWGWYDSI